MSDLSIEHNLCDVQKKMYFGKKIEKIRRIGEEIVEERELEN